MTEPQPDGSAPRTRRTAELVGLAVGALAAGAAAGAAAERFAVRRALGRPDPMRATISYAIVPAACAQSSASGSPLPPGPNSRTS